MRSVIDWLDHRTGCRGLLRSALWENIPGGARWRYVWGSTLVFTLMIQFITGIFLWMSYAPGSFTAWESVYFIQNELWGGWLLRGLHHYTAQVMTVLLVLHLLQVVIDGAYKAPREVNFWFGLGLLFLVLGLSLTGYLLPWDQKGFWATKVATSLVAIVPGFGPELQNLLIGGAEYGHQTLTRFFALHAGVLPGLVILLLILHVYLFRRHGITAKEPKRKPDTTFWPDQVLRDVVACLAVLATVLLLIVRPRLMDAESAMGAHLGAPADPSEPFDAARPDWYFLFLFQFLKLFEGGWETWGAIYIPGILVVLLILMPFIGRWNGGHRFNRGLLFGLLGGAGLLTILALAQDAGDPSYQNAVRKSEWKAQRAKHLAHSPQGIPPAGAAAMLRNDPLIQGPELFAENCSSCHRFNGHDGTGSFPTDPQSASDLAGFASRDWLRGLLDPEQIAGHNYFGGTYHEDGDMIEYVREDLANLPPEKREQLNKVVMALSAEAQLPDQIELDRRDADRIEQGRTLLREEFDCTDCHQFRVPDDLADAPDLTGYGSRQWLIDFISDPAHDRFYWENNDRMPRFGKEQILNEKSIGLIADWLRRDWYRPGPTQITERKTGDSDFARYDIGSPRLPRTGSPKPKKD
jgi:ubiquinol-cytochrome c reductase cytochrome b subunit